MIATSFIVPCSIDPEAILRISQTQEGSDSAIFSVERGNQKLAVILTESDFKNLVSKINETFDFFQATYEAVNTIK